MNPFGSSGPFTLPFDEVLEVSFRQLCMIQNLLHEVFFKSVDHNGTRCLQRARRKFGAIIVAEWFDQGSVEGRERARGVRKIKGNCRRVAMYGRDLERPIKPWHKFCCALFTFIASVQVLFSPINRAHHHQIPDLIRHVVCP